jgi:hypothetical protein
VSGTAHFDPEQSAPGKLARTTQGGALPPRLVFFDEERRDFCCEDRRFFPRRVSFDEERRDFCCEERRFFPMERRDFDAAPRPPAGIPGGYYTAGWNQVGAGGPTNRVLNGS